MPYPFVGSKRHIIDFGNRIAYPWKAEIFPVRKEPTQLHRTLKGCSKLTAISGHSQTLDCSLFCNAINISLKRVIGWLFCTGRIVFSWHDLKD